MSEIVCFIRQGVALLGKRAAKKMRKPLINMGWMMGLEPTTTGTTTIFLNPIKQTNIAFLPDICVFSVSFIFSRLSQSGRRILGTFLPIATRRIFA